MKKTKYTEQQINAAQLFAYVFFVSDVQMKRKKKLKEKNKATLVRLYLLLYIEV